MGTYTSNYNLFLPTVGETGWGTLVNGNFTTIDTTMKGLSNRITAVENEVNGNLSCTSVTTSGKVTANGGITSTTGTFSGAVTGSSFNGVVIKSSGTITVKPTNTIVGYLPIHSATGRGASITLLPYVPGCRYNGTIKFKNTDNNNRYVAYYTGITDGYAEITIVANGESTATFSNALYFVASAETAGGVQFYTFTLT